MPPWPGGHLCRLVPWQQVGTVGADASGKVGVEEQLSGGAELGNVAKLAPVDEQVAGGCGLRVAEGGGYAPLRLVNRLDQRRDLGSRVHVHRHDPATGYQRGMAVGAIVEERVHAIADGLGVVLEGEDLTGTVQSLSWTGRQLETAASATELPEDLAGAPTQLVCRPGVARADEQVALGVEVDSVDVEPIPGRGSRGGPRLVAIAIGDMVRAVPLKHHLAGVDGDLLDDPVEDLLVSATTDRGQVRRREGVGEDQRRIPRRDQELVKIRQVTVTGAHRGDLLVVGVVDVVG